MRSFNGKREWAMTLGQRFGAAAILAVLGTGSAAAIEQIRREEINSWFQEQARFERFVHIVNGITHG